MKWGDYMKNRFFDVNNNIYSNSLHIVLLLKYYKESESIDNMIIKLYLIKYPKILIDICRKYNIHVNYNLFSDFQYNNTQSQMLKYSLKLNVDGFYDALTYLYIKNLINYDIKNNLIIKTKKLDEIKLNEVPKSLILLVEIIDKLFNHYNVNEIRKSIRKNERSYYGK